MATPSATADRNKKIAKMYRDGKTLREIGAKVKLSHERISQILDDLGVKARKRGNPETNDRTAFLGVSVRPSVKDALLIEKHSRNMRSVSELVDETLAAMLKKKGYPVETGETTL
jgi:hypothetical protein